MGVGVADAGGAASAAAMAKPQTVSNSVGVVAPTTVPLDKKDFEEKAVQIAEPQKRSLGDACDRPAAALAARRYPARSKSRR